MKNILAIGLDRNLLSKKSTDTFERQKKYSRHLKELTIVVYTSEEMKELKDGNLRVIPTNSRNLFLGLFDLFFMSRKLLMEKSYDGITTQDPFFLGFLGYVLSRVYDLRFYPQLHIEAFENSYWRKESILNYMQYLVGLFVIRRADVVRVVSPRSQRYMEERKINSVFIPVSTDFKKFFVRENVKKKYDLLFIGRMVYQKNPSSMIRITQKLQKKYPDIQVAMVGEGPLLRRLKNEVSLKGLGDNIIFLGNISHEKIVDIMNESKIFVLPSYYEGWGLVCVEATFCGLPVVMSRTGCADEIIIDRKSGYVCEIGDDQAFVDRIQRYLKNIGQRDVHSFKAKEISLERLDTNRLVHKWVDLLNGKI